MITRELDRYFRSVLDIEGFSNMDSSMNGLQVDNDGTPVTKIAFAVDACLESFKRAREEGAGLIFVHHGLFWGKAEALTGVFRKRVKELLDLNLALYAAHIPLDQHEELGNNAALAAKLGITSPEPFGLYHGRKIGYKGKLSSPLTLDEAAALISHCGAQPSVMLPFGRRINENCAVISGGAPMEALQAIDEGIDLYVTGECSHSVYHAALEGGLNVLCGGHYATEVWGVQKLAVRAAWDLPVETCFVDLPTGL